MCISRWLVTKSTRKKMCHYQIHIFFLNQKKFRICVTTHKYRRKYCNPNIELKIRWAYLSLISWCARIITVFKSKLNYNYNVYLLVYQHKSCKVIWRLMDQIAHLNMKYCFYDRNKILRDGSVSDLLLTQYIVRGSISLYHL